MRPALSDEAVSVCLLIDMDHPSGFIYAATSLEPIDWNGQVYEGLGLVTETTGLEESAKVEVKEVSFTVNGVRESELTGLASSVKGRQATVRHAVLDQNNRVVEEPEIIDVVELDTQDYVVQPDGTASITITSHSAIVDLRRAANVLITPERQRALFPDDTGCDRIPDLLDRVASWTPS